MASDNNEIRAYAQPAQRGTWVQTERAGHEAWAALTAQAPRAAQLMHILVQHMDKQGALIISQATLAKLMETSVATTKRAIAILTKHNWIQTISVGGQRGGTLAYVVNSRIAWADKRDNLQYALFNARVLVSTEDQADLGNAKLKQLPTMEDGDIQLPAGPGMDPPAQESLDGMLPDMPSIPHNNS
ncbi:MULTISPECIES: helix-turn-helix domain-containing protein [Pseudomonas]|uniref:helix-turn-helix domain-containing protein n=1 Tax=Pseudomonas TaxID=286 RepID=UPI0021194172|nr:MULTISPECIES: helix-turn-helix domain-containing protein [Pseudomonas]